MRTIIAGSRTVTDYNQLLKAIEHIYWGKAPTAILSGGARGADSLGEKYAREKKLPLEIYRANWRTGKDAGYRRNISMAENADALIALWDGKSKGTKHMIQIAKKRNLLILVWRTDNEQCG